MSLLDFIILNQFFILGMMKYFDLKSHYIFKSYKLENFPSVSFSFPLGLMYLLILIYLYFVFQISDVIYLKVIVLGVLGAVNRWFWGLNLLLEFNLFFYFIFSILFLFTSFLLIKKRKIFNIDEIH